MQEEADPQCEAREQQQRDPHRRSPHRHHHQCLREARAASPQGVALYAASRRGQLGRWSWPSLCPRPLAKAFWVESDWVNSMAETRVTRGCR